MANFEKPWSIQTRISTAVIMHMFDCTVVNIRVKNNSETISTFVWKQPLLNFTLHTISYKDNKLAFSKSSVLL